MDDADLEADAAGAVISDKMAHIHPIPGILYRNTAPIPEGTPKVQGYDFNRGVDYSALLKSYCTTGLQATNVGLAVQQLNNMCTHKQLSDNPLHIHRSRRVFADASIIFPLLVAETFAAHANQMTASKKND